MIEPWIYSAERQLKRDRDLKQNRNRREEFAQYQPKRMNGDVGGRIRTDLSEKAAGLSGRKPRYRIFHGLYGRS